MAGQAEFLSDRVDRLACPEQVDHVVDGSSAARETRTTEAVVGIHGHSPLFDTAAGGSVARNRYRDIDASHGLTAVTIGGALASRPPARRRSYP
jgi:hypothetical protein